MVALRRDESLIPGKAGANSRGEIISWPGDKAPANAPFQETDSHARLLPADRVCDVGDYVH